MRWEDPQVVHLLFQAARFVAQARPLDGASTTPDVATSSADPTSPRAVIDAIVAQDPDAAVRAVDQVELEALRPALRDLLLDDPVVRPIFMAHVMKQTVVAFEDAAELGSRRPIAALVRFLASPRQERRTARLVGEAIRLVRDGATPRVLAT